MNKQDFYDFVADYARFDVADATYPDQSTMRILARLSELDEEVFLVFEATPEPEDEQDRWSLWVPLAVLKHLVALAERD